MSITWQTPGAATYASGTSVNVPYPATTIGDLLLMVIGQKPTTANSGTVTTPAGWSFISSAMSGGGYGTTTGADVGNTNLWAYSKQSAATASGTVAVTHGTTNNLFSRIFRMTSTSQIWSVAVSTGQDSTSGTAVSIATSTNPGVITNDLIIGVMCIPTDVTTPSQFGAEGFSQAGVAFGSVTEIGEFDSTAGNDIGGFAAWCTASGNATGNPTISGTASGTTTNVRGPGMFIRVREEPFLTLSECFHNHIVDAVVITTAQPLVVQDATHAHTAASPAVFIPYVVGTADFWETFDFSALTTGNLDSNDSTAEGTWSITDASSRLSMSGTGEKQAPGIFNGSDDNEGTHGLGYTNSGTAFQPGLVRYDFAAGKTSGLSWAFWFYAPSAMVGTWGEHDICAMYNLTESDDVFIKANDSTDGTNLDLYIHNSTAYSTNKVTLPELNKWYWIAAQWLPGVSWKFSVFDENMDLVGEVTHQTTPSVDDLDFIILGSFTGASTTGMAGTMWFDDLVMDWTSPSQSYPLLGVENPNKTLVVADGAHGLGNDAITLQVAQPLVVADALHAHTAESPVLAVAQPLVVADALHAHTADNVTLIMPGGEVALVVAEATHAHTSDAITLQIILGQWLMNEAAWNGTPGEVVDSSGSGNNGTAYGGATTVADGKFGRCGDFDGDNDSVRLGNPDNFKVSEGTLACWIKPTDPCLDFRSVFQKTNAFGLYLWDLEVGCWDWTASAWRGTGVYLNDGRWHLIGMSFRSGVANGTTLYIDGVAVLTTQMTIVNQGGGVDLGSQSNTLQFVHAKLDHATLYSWPLSEAEWAALASPELVVADAAHAVSSDMLDLLLSVLLEVYDAYLAHTAGSPAVFSPVPVTLAISSCLHYDRTRHVQQIGGLTGMPLVPSAALHYHNSTNVVLEAA